MNLIITVINNFTSKKTQIKCIDSINLSMYIFAKSINHFHYTTVTNFTSQQLSFSHSENQASHVLTTMPSVPEIYMEGNGGKGEGGEEEKEQGGREKSREEEREKIEVLKNEAMKKEEKNGERKKDQIWNDSSVFDTEFLMKTGEENFDKKTLKNTDDINGIENENEDNIDDRNDDDGIMNEWESRKIIGGILNGDIGDYDKVDLEYGDGKFNKNLIRFKKNSFEENKLNRRNETNAGNFPKIVGKLDGQAIKKTAFKKQQSERRSQFLMEYLYNDANAVISDNNSNNIKMINANKLEISKMENYNKESNGNDNYRKKTKKENQKKPNNNKGNEKEDEAKKEEELERRRRWKESVWLVAQTSVLLHPLIFVLFLTTLKKQTLNTLAFIAQCFNLCSEEEDEEDDESDDDDVEKNKVSGRDFFQDLTFAS